MAGSNAMTAVAIASAIPSRLSEGKFCEAPQLPTRRYSSPLEQFLPAEKFPAPRKPPALVRTTASAELESVIYLSENGFLKPPSTSLTAKTFQPHFLKNFQNGMESAWVSQNPAVVSVQMPLPRILELATQQASLVKLAAE